MFAGKLIFQRDIRLKINFLFVLRLCLLPCQILKSMFHCSIGQQTYAEIYEQCTGFSISESPELPNRICNSCEINLISYHNFRVNIEVIEERLDVYLSRLQQKTDEVHSLEETWQEADCLQIPQDDDDETHDSFVIEELYEDDQMIDETVDEMNDENEYVELDSSSVDQCQGEDEITEQELVNVGTSCRFIQSQDNPKEVKCTNCLECQLEMTINGVRHEQDFSITCECENVFKNRRSFVKHYSTIHNRKDSIFQCRTCQESFKNWRSRVAHEANVHNVGLKFQCSVCSKKFYRSDHWKEHERSCNKIVDPSEKFFSCAVCLYTFQREETYKKHLQTAHVGADEGDQQFVKRVEEYAQKHSKTRSAVNETLTTASAEESDNQSMKKEATCTVCAKVFKNALSLSKHTSLFHTNQVWSCDKCDAVFVHRSTKISHMSKVHGQRKPFECHFPSCDFSCFKKDRFNAHVDKHKNPDKKFPCPICQQEFKSYNSMTFHRARHLTTNTFTCATCSKQFLDKRNYNIHLKLHTGEDLHHCPSCSRGFNRKDHLQKHQKRKNHYDEVEDQE